MSRGILISTNSCLSLSPQQKSKQIIEVAEIMRKESMSSRGVISTKDKNNFNKYRRMLSQ